jgi:hypothetical protein
MSEQEPGYPCPNCGATTDWDLDCPGYGQPGHVMVCWPPDCGNAIRYFCSCGWWFRDPNNRDATGMGPEPAWIEEARKSLVPHEDEEDNDL